ncbi:MAG: nicotinamide riboside transporter PnuC [Actinomycetota bacterium]|jgi:nicotinamide mononucleotide transporter|nr:nicotinamide riboside transporter PnuC [Actinomycetota bacterium]
MGPVHWLLDGTWSIDGQQVLHREVFGNVFGLASAILGMRRLTWAWPVGIVGNVVLFTVFVSGIFDKPQVHDLWGQAGRQVFFLIVSVYGWWRWQRSKRLGGAADGGAIAPRWARANELRAMILAGTVMMFVFFYTLRYLGSFGPLPDAWILTGSILATYGMARGYVEFWWIWIGVDVVGVPLLYQAKYYPSAVMYLVYGAFCLAGFVSWARAEQRLRRGGSSGEPTPESQEAMTRA